MATCHFNFVVTRAELSSVVREPIGLFLRVFPAVNASSYIKREDRENLLARRDGQVERKIPLLSAVRRFEYAKRPKLRDDS
jgi:hypothetical protein